MFRKGGGGGLDGLHKGSEVHMSWEGSEVERLCLGTSCTLMTNSNGTHLGSLATWKGIGLVSGIGGVKMNIFDKDYVHEK